MNLRKQRRAEERKKRKIDKIISVENPRMEFKYELNILRGLGPIINTWITITEEHKKLLESNNIAIPNLVQCRFLIDTGAFKTLVKHEIAQQSGLKLINSNQPIHGIGVDTTGKTYIGRILFRCESKRISNITHEIWVDTEIASGSLDNKYIDGLIGRDVLQYFDFRYNGKNGEVILIYLKN